MGQIGGVFPGGPPRRSDGEEPQRPLRSGEEVEGSISDRKMAMRARRKRRTMMVALGVIAAAAASGGVYFGIQARSSAEQLAEEERAAQEGTIDLDATTRRVMDELWRMEEIEAARGRR